MSRKLIGVATMAALALWSAAAAAETVKVGLIASFTGAFSTWGVQFQRGVEAYQSVYGKTVKGPDGKEHEIQFIYRDSTSAGPDKAKQLADELVLRERVKFLTGLELSPYAMALSDISQQAKVPVVMMNAATAMITRMSPYFVRVSLTIPQVVVPAAQWAYQNGVRKVYIVVSDYAPGYDAETYFAKTFKALGGEIVGMARTPQQETNFSAYMEKVLQAKPDALYMFQPVGSVSIAFVKAYAERGLKAAGIKLIGGAETQEILLPNFTDEVVGTITASHYSINNTFPANVAMRGALKKLYGDKVIPDAAAIHAWDGTALIHQAVAALGPNADGLKYVEFMRGRKIDSPRGPVMIDADERDIIQNIYIRRVEKRDGHLENVDIATVEMVKDPWKLDNPPKSN